MKVAGQGSCGPGAEEAAAARGLVRKHALARPAWGHRKIWVKARHERHTVSQPGGVAAAARRGDFCWPWEYHKEALKTGAIAQGSVHAHPGQPEPGVAGGLLRARSHCGWGLADRGCRDWYSKAEYVPCVSTRETSMT